MTNRNTILNELQGLESTLANLNPQNVYSVPVDYFEGLAYQILNRVKANDTSNAKEETRFLSSTISGISRDLPYAVPTGYFESLSENLMKGIREHADYQTSKEELSSISPLLDSIHKTSPYSIPDGYFEKLEIGIEKKETKVVSITSWRKVVRYAAAAVLVGIVSVSAFMIIKPKPIDPNENPQAWVKKNLNKKVDSDKIDEFMSLSAEDETLKNSINNSIANTDEIKELMKDVSEKEIQKFLNETVALESNEADDILMNL